MRIHRPLPFMLRAPLDATGPGDRQPVQRGFVLAYQGKDPWTFVASSEAVDRYGDIIVASGWQLKNFKKNPIALWQHQATSPIGTWKDVQIVDDKLMATLELAKAGTSTIVDMLRGMIEQRVLRAVSVGFQPINGQVERIMDDKGNWTGGYRYLKSELLEISVVSVPANPEAISVAKAMGISAEEQALLFTKEQPAPTTVPPRSGPSARPVNPKPNKDKANMATLAERIAAKDGKIATLRDQITELGAAEDIEERMTELDELNTALEEEVKSVEALRKAQATIAASAAPAGDDEPKQELRSAPTGNAPALIRSRGKKDPADLFFRTAAVIARGYQERRSYGDIISKDYAGSKELETMVKAATDPAMTHVTGWAAELVGETVGAFIDVLRPGSIFFNVPMATFTFGRSKLRLPTRQSGNLAGAFVAEGAPIPVKSVLLASVRMEPYKLGVITTFTREIANFSDPAIEPLLRDMMVGDTRETIDALFLDASAAVATLRPAGLQNLAGANTAPSSGNSLANIITDLKAAIAAMSANKMGRQLAWIMNTQRALSLSLVTNAAGNFMFRDELASGTLMGIPLFASTTVPADVVYLVDGAELAAAYDSTPMIDMSEQATLHMESVPATVPPTTGTVAPIVDAAAAVADPVRSLFQTASIALRLLWDMTWNQRRAGAVYTITAVGW